MMDLESRFEKWKILGFSKHNAEKWMFEGFDLQQAKQWLDNGFSLESAISFRKEGITPFDVKSSIINEIRSDLR